MSINKIARKVLQVFFASLFGVCIHTNSFSQNFVKVTDASNPVVTETFSGNYFGASWVDINNDGRLDLYINRKTVYKNLGNGNFSKLATSIGNIPTNLGQSWSDYNNDGFIDCFVVSTGATSSYLYRNNGSENFDRIVTGEIGDSAYNTGWGCAWADYDNDGYTDLFISAANNFGIVNHPNRLYHNNNDGTFSRMTFHGLTDTLGPFTIPSWSDYDSDGDMDLFIGTGPGGSTSYDYFYKNLFSESGTANITRLYIPPMTSDLVDGQVWNWIDYDNDGDLDAFLTNYANAVPNNLYRNNNGTYVRMTQSDVGTIVSDLGLYLTNLWGDFDNDGDLDCFVTRESAQSRYYTNNANGTFTRRDSLAVVINSGSNFGATAGDYDNNGTLDLYVTGTSTSHGLFRNNLSNGYSWINIKCIGSAPSANGSNKSAIGAKVKAKANINGVSTWQYREISSQNSFNSMNMLNVHFGFGNATVIDSLIIIWPKGLTEVYTNLGVNQFYKAVEGQGIISGISEGKNFLPENFYLHQNYPNPFNPVTKISYELQTGTNFVSIKIFDILGNEVKSLVNKFQASGIYEITFDAKTLSSGVYFYRMELNSENTIAGNYTASFSPTMKMLLVK